MPNTFPGKVKNTEDQVTATYFSFSNNEAQREAERALASLNYCKIDGGDGEGADSTDQMSVSPQRDAGCVRAAGPVIN